MCCVLIFKTLIFRSEINNNGNFNISHAINPIDNV